LGSVVLIKVPQKAEVDVVDGQPHPRVLVLRAPHACHQPASFACRLDDVAAAQAIGAIVSCVERIGDAAT
jgi:hypothetical protein